jgi:hypothetical protein
VTHAELRARYGFGTDHYDPHDNDFARTMHSRVMLACFSKRLFLGGLGSAARVDSDLTSGILCRSHRSRHTKQTRIGDATKFFHRGR